MFGVPVITLSGLCSPPPQASVLVVNLYVQLSLEKTNSMMELCEMTTFQLLIYVDKRYSLVTNVCLSMITVFPVRCPLVNSVYPQRIYKRRVSIKASYWQYTDTCKTSFRAQPPILPPVTAFGNPCCAGSCLCKGALIDLLLHRLSSTKLQAMTGQDL